MKTRVVLVGGGHAHLHVVSQAEAFARAGAELTLIDQGTFWYSGMATGMLAGQYAPEEDTVDLKALCHRFGVTFYPARVTGLDRHQRRVQTETGQAISYDLLSFNVGSVVDIRRIDDADALAWTVKPIAALEKLRTRLAGWTDEGPCRSVAVVGGGPSGAEIAASIDALSGRTGGHIAVTLLHSGPRLLPGLPQSAAETLSKLLDRRGIEVRATAPIAKIRRRAGGVIAAAADGSELEFDEVVLATGLVASPVVSALGLGEGGLRVDARLACEADATIFGAGDCIALAPRELPKVGVFGVRQAPVLADNLLASITAADLRQYRPQDKYLIIMNLGDGTGLAIRGNRHWHGRLALKLKHFLDKRFLGKYRQ